MGRGSALTPTAWPRAEPSTFGPTVCTMRVWTLESIPESSEFRAY